MCFLTYLVISFLVCRRLGANNIKNLGKGVFSASGGLMELYVWHLSSDHALICTEK